jgi:prepilin-type N-terminal cleavage/methylation domain-containing protein
MLRSHGSPSSNRRAFTLVEIMVVVVIVGLLAAIGMPTFRQVTLRSKATALVNDIRQFTTAFTTYSHQHGRWPADTDPGVLPPEMVGAISENFSRPTPIGGQYEWEHDVSPLGFPVRAAIAVVTANGFQLTNDAALVEMVDRMMDDGNLSTGLVQYNAGTLLFVIEQ